MTPSKRWKKFNFNPKSLALEINEWNPQNEYVNRVPSFHNEGIYKKCIIEFNLLVDASLKYVF